jgi:hypothetical protein
MPAGQRGTPIARLPIDGRASRELILHSHVRQYSHGERSPPHRGRAWIVYAEAEPRAT